MVTPFLMIAALAAPPTLGDGLRAIDAFGPSIRGARYTPSVEPPRTGAKILIATGAALVIGGLVGALFSGGCNTLDAESRCLDARTADDVYPTLSVIGLGLTMSGTYWYRRDSGTQTP